jgi:hypothetical protein
VFRVLKQGQEKPFELGHSGVVDLTRALNDAEQPGNVVCQSSPLNCLGGLSPDDTLEHVSDALGLEAVVAAPTEI